MLASRVGSIIDMLDVMGVVKTSRERELLCKDVMLDDIDAELVTVEMDRLVKLFVAWDFVVTTWTSGLVTVMVRIGMDN